MENILELLYDLPDGNRKGQDSAFSRAARINIEHMELFSATLTDEQKELWEAYSEADAKIAGMRAFARFRYAFHLGAQLMAELMEGKQAVL